MSDQVLVVAIKKGFYHGIRDVGTEFYVPAGLVNPKVKTWFKPVEEKPKASAAARQAQHKLSKAYEINC